MVGTLLQDDVSCGLSKRFSLSNGQETVRLALPDGDSDDERGEQRSAVSVELLDEPAEKEAWYFPDLQTADLRGVLALKSIRNLCTNYNLNDTDSRVDVQSIFVAEIASILKLVELPDLLAKAKENCTSHTQ